MVLAGLLLTLAMINCWLGDFSSLGVEFDWFVFRLGVKGFVEHCWTLAGTEMLTV